MSFGNFILFDDLICFIQKSIFLKSLCFIFKKLLNLPAFEDFDVSSLKNEDLIAMYLSL